MEQPNQHNDRFADYLLGEMDGTECADFEAMLESSPDTGSQIKEMEELFGLLKDSLQDEWESNALDPQFLSAEEEQLMQFAAGEMTDEAEMTELVNSLETDAELAEQLAGLDDVVSLLKNSLTDEWITAESSSIQNEVEVTSFALRETSSIESNHLEEMQAIEKIAFDLQQNFSREITDNDKVNFDDPAFTDYVLGEMSSYEVFDYEEQLSESFLARKELDSTRDLVNLLSDSLTDEWHTFAEVPDSTLKVKAATEPQFSEPQFSIVEAPDFTDSNEWVEDQVEDQVEEESNIVKGSFARKIESMRSAGTRHPVYMSLAAVLTGLLVVGAMISDNLRFAGQNSASSGSVASAQLVDHGWIDEAELSSRGEVRLVAEPEVMPNLLLIDELPEGFDLASQTQVAEGPYLEKYPTESGFIPTSMSPALMQDSTTSEFPGFAPLSSDFDSFLPTVSSDEVGYSFHEGSIGEKK